MSRLDDLWRREHWWDDPPPLEVDRAGFEVALAAAIAGSHVVDHLVVPRRFHLLTHLASAGGAVVAALAAGATLDDLGLRPQSIPKALARGAISASAIAAAIGLGAALPATRRWFDDERVLDVSAGEAVFRGLVEIPVGTAVYEEVVFRGVVMGLALRRLPALPAVLVTSGLFGLWHVLPSIRDREHNPATREQHPATVTLATVLNTAAVGVLLGWQRLRTNSVVAPILAHAASNSIAFLAAAAVSRRTGDGGAAQR
jgi:membrane protease YdiL (CAAX protease family)